MTHINLNSILYILWFVGPRNDHWECKQFIDSNVCVWTRLGLGLNHRWTHTLKTIDHAGHVPTWICELILSKQIKAKQPQQRQLRSFGKRQNLKGSRAAASAVSFQSLPRSSQTFQDLPKSSSTSSAVDFSRCKVPVYFTYTQCQPVAEDFLCQVGGLCMDACIA